MHHAWFSWNDYLKEHMLTGHKNGKVFFKKWPTSFPNQDSSTFGPAGGLHTEVSSYANFLIGLMEGKGLSKTLFAEMFKPQVSMTKESNYFTMEGISAWGLGIKIKPVSYGTLNEHGGNNGNFQSGF